MFETNGNIVLSQVTFLMSGHFCFIPCSNWSSGLQKSVIIRPVCPAQTLSLKVSREEGWSSHDEYLRVFSTYLAVAFCTFSLYILHTFSLSMYTAQTRVIEATHYT